MIRCVHRREIFLYKMDAHIYTYELLRRNSLPNDSSFRRIAGN